MSTHTMCNNLHVCVFAPVAISNWLGSSSRVGTLHNPPVVAKKATLQMD